MTIGTISIFVGVVLLIFLKMFFKGEESPDQNKGFHGIDHEEMFREDLDFDPSWSILSSNTHHTDDD
ncbi:MAG: hypothetical protein U9O82_06685 [Thermodesulfobacteriota bacterium]|nr:hypothetical protein [Thermodesulfobacteriota bacterium]